MTRVLATGTFDLLHPGHLYFLEQAAALGDELWVIVARSSNLDHKAQPVNPAEQRRAMVAALDPVDEAILGSEESIYEPLRTIQPDVVALGHDQGFSIDTLEADLADRGFDVEVLRVNEVEAPDGLLYSSSDIIDRIVTTRGVRVERPGDRASATAQPPLFR